MSDTESFEVPLSELMGYCDDSSYATRLCARLKAAHEREIRDTAQQQYHRGYEAGRRSMDAEHRAISMRLRGLRFDGGSHENLARIAYAIYPCATGWTCESAAGLRDRLIDLMGGVSDDTCSCAGGGACDVDCGDDSGKQEEVEHGGTTHDCVDDSRGGSGSELVHLDGLVAYDVLDNERRKAIAELRKIHTDAGGFVKALAKALGVEWQAPRVHQTLTIVRDRLIHLLGGDQPSGIDVLCAMDAESDADGTCPNDDQILSITNELRRWALTEVPYHYGHQLQGIADRIDEQFDRICQQHENVLQSTIEHMVDENLTVKDERDHWKRLADVNAKALLRMGGENARLHAECERLRKRLDSITEVIERIKSVGQE